MFFLRLLLLSLFIPVLVSCAYSPAPQPEIKDSQAYRKVEIVKDFDHPMPLYDGEFTEITSDIPHTFHDDTRENIPAMPNAAPRGLNTKPLIFDSMVENEDARFNRLENVVQTLHNDIADIKALLEVRQNATALEQPAPKPVPKAKAPVKKAAPKKATPPKVTTTHKSGITAVRAFDHPGYTRIAFESPVKLAPTVQLDTLEKIAVIDFGDQKMHDNIASVARNSKLIKTASVNDNNTGGALVALGLSADSSIIRKELLPPDNRYPLYRYFIDFKR